MARHDGRAPGEIRPVSIIPDFILYPEGSVLISCGNTKVICNATVEENVPPFLKGQGRGWVTAEYNMLPRATQTRSPRDISKLKLNGRAAEIQRLIGRALRSVTDLDGLGERCITVDCDVIQADGGTRTASITGAWVALHDALAMWVEAGKIERIPLTGQVAAISMGVVDGNTLLDLDYSEDSHAEVDMNLVATDTGEMIELQGTGEQAPFDRKRLNALLDLGDKGIAELIELQRQAIA